MQSVDSNAVAQRFAATYDQQGAMAAGMELRKTLSGLGYSPEEILSWADEHRHLVHEALTANGWELSDDFSDDSIAEVIDLEDYR